MNRNVIVRRAVRKKKTPLMVRRTKRMVTVMSRKKRLMMVM